MTKNEFLTRARNIHGYKYEYPSLPNKIQSNEDVEILYNNVLYKQKVVKHILLGRCPEKNTPSKTTEQFIEEAKKVWGKEKYDYSLVNYRGALKKVKIIYNNIVYEQVATSHIRGIAPEIRMNQEAFIYKATNKWLNKYDYSLVEYSHCKSKVKILYNGVIYEQTPEQHLICAPENIKLAKRKTTEQFILEANIIHDNKYSYNKTNYIKNQIKVTIICPIHGDFDQIPLSHIKGSGCSLCYESKGEKAIAKLLNKLEINFNRQKKFSECKNVYELPFDFYITSKRMCIEFDGIQHHEPLDFFGGQEAFEKLKINDEIKNRYCEDNYINLIRIKYNEFNDIEKILTPFLLKI
jgi:very-short-patch-repair endonuclease